MPRGIPNSPKPAVAAVPAPVPTIFTAGAADVVGADQFYVGVDDDDNDNPLLAGVVGDVPKVVVVVDDAQATVSELSMPRDILEPKVVPYQIASASASASASAWQPRQPSYTVHSCLNCGQSQQQILQGKSPNTYHCPVCGHDWTQANEHAPFRNRVR